MKVLQIGFAIFMFVRCACGNGIPQGAVDYFANKYGHQHPDTVQIVPVAFRRDGSQEFLMTFAKGDWEGPEAVWTVVESKNGQWGEPKAIDIDGETKDFSAMTFDPSEASFVYLPSYKCNGLLEHSRKGNVWTFTCLIGDAIYTQYFWTASQVGLTDDALKKLMDAHRVSVRKKIVP